jgi:hypothetical protein
MTWFKGAGTMMVTLFIFVIVGVWLYFTATKVDVAPIFNSKGVATIDQYQRAKDILQIVFPLATAAVGFWFGNQQTAQAQKQADSATQRASDAHQQAQASQAKVEAILGASSDPNLMQKAAAAAPSAFANVAQVPGGTPPQADANKANGGNVDADDGAAH